MAWTLSASSRESYAHVNGRSHSTGDGNPAVQPGVSTELTWGSTRSIALVVLIALQVAAVAAIASQPTLTEGLIWVVTALGMASVIGLAATLGEHLKTKRPQVVHSLDNGTHREGIETTTVTALEFSQPALENRDIPLDQPLTTHSSGRAPQTQQTQSATCPSSAVPHDVLTELLQQVHHELRTPLNAVIGFTDLMQKETFGPLGSPRYAEYLNHIRESGELLLKSAEETLAMTTVLATTTDADTSQKHHQDNACITDLATQAWAKLPIDLTRLGFTLSISGSSARLLGDETTIVQALTNLLSEAIAQSQASGVITLSASVINHMIHVEVRGADPLPDTATSTPSLDLCIARTLLQQYGGGVLTDATPGNRWRALTTFEHARQTDLFNEPHANFTDYSPANEYHVA
ncbi:MAG: HAMP domain-containing sensor histidine kinase [Pseudomonadota bacterium]